MRLGPVPATGRAANPVVITDAGWYRLADDLAVALASSPRGLIWVTAERGAGKTAWLQALMPAMRTDFYLLDLRGQQETASVLEQLQGYSNHLQGTLPALLLDNLSPADLMSLLAEPEHPARQLIPNYNG
ncbi:MAG: hypothetical protein ACOCVV_12485, partial [Marinobacter sp.]